ncbi:small subunit processome component 20 -like, partial [Asbolus verrucosus]
MKNKPTRHKDSNIFKFQPFAERIANIDIDIFHRIGHENEADGDDAECYFYQAIEHWSILNLTESFDSFKKEIKAHTLVTLPQLILDKERVVEVLLKHLSIVVAVAKDLHKDFYQYYKEFLEVLIDLLNTKDTEQLEWTFTSLAYLFKFLWRSFVKDIATVFNTLLPLLSNTRPDYINSFAAGSFAFVARKVKDWPTFLLHILKTVKTKRDGVEGCGKLFFEIIHGVSGQFHSCAQTVLPFLFESLSNTNLPQDTLFEIMEQMIGNMVVTIHPQKSELLWNCLTTSLDNLVKNWKNSKEEKVAVVIELILKLLGQSVEHRQGRMLLNPFPVIQTISNVLSNGDLPESTLLYATQIYILLLLSKNVKLTQEQASTIVKKVLSLSQESVLLYFVDNVSSFTAFEALILPTFLKHCLGANFNDEFAKILTHLILKKAPLVKSGIDLPKWTKYPIDFGSKENNLLIENIFLERLNVSEFENYISSLICLPHLHLIDGGKIEYERTNEDKSNLKKLLFLLNNTVECIIHLNQFDVMLEHFNIFVDILTPLAEEWDYIWALNILNLLITALQNHESIVNMTTLLTLNKVLASNFSSPYHEIRLLTAHLYTFFEHLSEFDLKHSSDPDVPKEEFAVFSICYRVESIDPQVHTYRDQLQNLEKLNFDKPQMIMCNKTDFKTIPLRYLCGCLYINFKLLWDPVMNIIETHAHGLKVDEFWGVYGEELKKVVERIRNWETKESGLIVSKWTFLEDLYQTSEPLEETVDEGYEDETTQTKETKELAPKFIKGKSNLQALLRFLAVFSKIRSPKSMYREPELNKLYFDFLQHKNPEVQTLALDCIMNYKHKFLIPYKDNLYNLIDDKKFKSELTAFRIDKDANTVQEEHREDLVPIIMRIVFSKMIAKTGLRTGGKSSGQLRRNLVLRFLAGCEEKEMLTFIKMVMRYYNKYLREDPEMMVDVLSKDIDLENFLPPKRIQSTINLLNVILEQFGGLMGNDLLTFILEIVLIIGAALKGAFQQISNVHAGYLPILRTLRTSSIKIIERFFEQFDRYPWTSKQINAVFKVFVWPYLDKLNVEGIHSPTTLLKLFIQWGSNPRYFSLLVKHEHSNPDQFVLPHVIELLLNEKSNLTVVKAIEEMLEKLLSLQADEEDLQLVIPIDNLLPIAKHILDRITVDDKLNYGSCILLPYIPSVLKKIKRKLEGKNKNLNQRELFILSRISELVWEADISASTLKLLLPIVLKRCTGPVGEEVVMQLLTTVNNLLNKVSNPQEHLKQISPLFGEVSFGAGRKLLIQILKIICKNGNLNRAPALIEGLNAFDQKWIDQPDFQKRHDTFTDIQKAIDAQQIEVELGILIIYNCFYLLKNEKDLSMRENSSHGLKQLCHYLIVKHPKELDYLLNETVLSLIRSGMKSRNDYFRNECIQFLGHLSRECPESHVVFRDLNRYTNKNDLEVDFFENITHLQLHRHARALLKFSSVTKELNTSPNIRTLTQFVLPLASFYLCNEKYAGKNSVIDAAIDCFGVVCRILPWHQYEGILKYYLAKLRKNVDHQKQLVRIIVIILDTFHYDLSKGQISSVQGDKIEEENREITVEEENESTELQIDEALDLQTVEDEEDEESVKNVTICEKIPVLCKSTATRVTRSIQTVLLPQLHKALAELTHHDTSHKINRKKTGFEREEEDLLRVPISLALVKLLQRLPKEILEANLPGIFMKLCTFLKSHLESVRRVTRETLQKIMQTLGPDYLHLLLGEMIPLLNRGFQVHVLVFTIHAVLNCLKEFYKPTDIDRILLTVLQLCEADLFGSLSEEKEVAKISVKTSEAKSTKSFDTFQILAQFVTDKCLMDLVLPIKNVLQTSHSFKTVHKAEECLRHIALGLVDNNFVQIQSLLIFAYGTASESIPELIAQKKATISEKEKEILQRKRADCFIIPKLPVGRSGVRLNNVKSSAKTNAHLLIEFGLRLCFVMLKREKLKDDNYKPYLDPFVVVFKNCLTSKHVKLSTLTLQCLSWVFKYELPSLKEYLGDFVKEMFAILHKYASAGLSKGDNFDLVVATFKAIAVLVRDVKHHTIDADQLKMLLLYAEQDIHDHDRQATAFNLLKAIISRKLIVPEIHDVMQKVAELSVTSEMNHVRTQSRVVFHQYLMDYPLGDKLEKYVSFYVSQMSYEMQYGRESAIEMIKNLITSFPMKTLKEYSGTLFVTMGARLVNDEAPECRKQVAECLSLMLTRLGKKESEPLFDVVVLWLKDNKVSHRRLAAQLCGIFVSVEKCSFETRLPKLLPLILKQFGLEEKDDEEFERVKDHHLFQVVQMLLKICAQCPSFFKLKPVEDIARQVQGLLGHPHDWVRLSAAQFIGFVLSDTDIDELATLVANNEKRESGFLQTDPVKTVKSLTLDLCDQLRPGNIKSDLAEQVIKNLVFIARVLRKVPVKEGDDRKINLLWLTKRMRKIVNSEVVENTASTVLRNEVFKWIAAVATVLDLENITPIFSHLLAPLVREMITTEESNAPLRQLSKEVANLLKKKVGVEEYTKALSNLQQILSAKRAERKRARTQLAVTDPEVFAKKKIKRHEKKKDAKKRRIAEMKGTKKNFKRRKVVDLDPEAEKMHLLCLTVVGLLVSLTVSYDPTDPEVSSVLPPKGRFEAFYPRGEEGGSSRAAHSHGSFYKYRNPALVDAKNAAAYGFRFDGGR